ncbi:hypothetical protein B0T17DRAFT_654287, partial [Bombardia bombarda]
TLELDINQPTSSLHICSSSIQDFITSYLLQRINQAIRYPPFASTTSPFTSLKPSTSTLPKTFKTLPCSHHGHDCQQAKPVNPQRANPRTGDDHVSGRCRPESAANHLRGISAGRQWPTTQSRRHGAAPRRLNHRKDGATRELVQVRLGLYVQSDEGNRSWYL